MNHDIMNHDSGFIIGIARKFCKNPNRTFTKSILKITLTVLIFDEKSLRVSFSIAEMREQLVRLNSIVFMIFTDYRKHLKSPYSYYFLFGEATAKSREIISELTFKPCLEYA